MGERICDYCKCQVPIDAIACGHCGKDIPYRKETRFCRIHNRNYDVDFDIKRGEARNTCPTCEKGKREKLLRELENNRQMKREIDNVQEQAWKGFYKGSYYELEKWAEKALGWRSIFLKLIFGFPIIASILAGILYLALDISFDPGFLICYSVLIIWRLVIPKIRLNTLTAEYEKRRDAAYSAENKVKEKYGR